MQFEGLFVRMKIILLISIRNSYVSLIRYSVIPPLDFDIYGWFKINNSDIDIYYRSIIHLENSKLIYLYETSNITYVTKRCRITTYVYPVNNT